MSDEKAYKLYEELHKKFPDQDIINLLDHSGADSYDYTNPATGITEQRISAPSNNATFGSQEMQDFVNDKLGVSPDQVPPVDASSGVDATLVSNTSDAPGQAGDISGVDINKSVESHSTGPMIFSEDHGSDLSTGEKVLIAGAAGAAAGGAYHLYRNRNQGEDGSNAPEDGNGDGGGDTNGEAPEPTLDERIAATVEEALLRQREEFEVQMIELRDIIDQQNMTIRVLKEKLAEKDNGKDKEESGDKKKSEKGKKSKSDEAKKKVKKAKKKTKKAQKKAKKEKTKRKVAEAVLATEREAGTKAELAVERAKAEAEARATLERERTRGDMLTKA
jgi:hypothetical protein